MEIYIDKEFIRKYWSLNASSILSDFENNFLKKTNSCKIICNYESLDEIKEKEEDLIFFELLIEDIPEILFIPSLKSDDSIEQCISTGGFKLFLMEFDESKINKMELIYGYQFFNTANLKRKWSEHQLNNNTEKTLCLPINLKDCDVFNSWNDLNFIGKTPSNSIVILDRYILSEKRKIKNNLIPIIENILPINYDGLISVVIISENIWKENGNAISAIERIKKIHGFLNSYFAKYKRDIKFSIIELSPNFNFINLPNFHDRHIYTNYYTIKSGYGFDVFKSKKGNVVECERITIDSEIVIKFNFYKSNMKTTQRKIDDVKKYIKYILEELETESVKIYPNRKPENKLLQF